MPWNPDRYNQFQKERSAPFQDLIKLVRPRPRMTVVDLGCGTGELTLRMATRLPQSTVLGVDSSAEMLARASTIHHPGLEFRQGDLTEVSGQYDLVLSNAAIQWVPDHRSLVPRLFSMLRAEGQLCIQVPSNRYHPSHVVVEAVAREEPFSKHLSGWTREKPVLDIEGYAQLLYDCGASDITVFEKIYPHVLADADAVADWMSGTALVPYMERLPPEVHAPFMERYRATLRGLMPAKPLFYGFRRILISAFRK